MTPVNVDEAMRELRSLETQENTSSMRGILQALGDAISVGDISESSGIAIGRNIRQVINHFELSPDTAAALLDLRAALGGRLGLDASSYRWGPLIVDRTREFTGRGHVFAAIDDFLTTNRSGYLVLRGDPGIGKSSVLCEYIRRTGCIAHFNVRALGVTTAEQFLQGVCSQLITAAGLPYAVLPAHATRDGSFLLTLLAEARKRWPPGQPLVIAVDALDEAVEASQPQSANLLCLPPVLPDGVYFVMTSRDADLQFVTQSPYREFDLMAYPAENRADIESYLAAALTRPALAAWAADRELSQAGAIATLAELSEDNFMYLRFVLPEIEAGPYRALDVGRLPRGLASYYEDHWRTMGMTARPLPRTRIRIIFVLCEARQAVSRRLLADMTTDPADELTVQEVLDAWKQFLHEHSVDGQPRYALYHSSFRDFLHRKDIVQAAGVTIEGINALIADSLWNSVFAQ